MSDQMSVIHEYSIVEMPKRRLLALFRKGARLYKVCENETCIACNQYTPIRSDEELMTYCLQCGKKVIRYGVEKGA